MDLEDYLIAAGWGFLVFMLYISVSESVRAQEYKTATLTWDPVTGREDGAELKPGELVFYEITQVDGDRHLVGTYETTPDVHEYDIQVLAGECHLFTIKSAATPGPSCKPEQTYQLSRPSGEVSNCKSDLTPKPPRNFE